MMNIEASVVVAVIMNRMIICSFAACSTEDPPRMVPVIVPRIAMMPVTLCHVEGD
jgi:hypothetical protein